MMKRLILQALSAVVLLLATLTPTEIDARLPPKLLKAASAASKALYARGYGYSVVPIPQKILLQTNVARREIHHPARPPRRSKRPRRGKRPPTPYASRYQDYRPTRKRRPPPIRDPPDYQDQQEIEEDFEYDDRNYKEFDDFVHKHAELYAEGYNTRGKPSRTRYKDEEGAYTEHSSPVYVRRKPNVKNWSGLRPSTKLYSAAIALPQRYQREEEEEEAEEGSNQEYTRGFNRWRYRDEEDEEGYGERDEEPPYTYYRNRYPYSSDNPDDYYHDRKYQIKKEKFRRPPQFEPKVLRPPPSDRKAQANTAAWNDDDMPKSRDVAKANRNPPKAGSSFTVYDNNGRKNVVEPQRSKWFEPTRPAKQPQTPEEQWRTQEVPTAFGLSQWEEDKETDIITKQNAGLWEGRSPSGIKKSAPKEDFNSWVKEHSVGYGIEIEGGQRKMKVENADPDVVYGQSGYSKPRIPDLGYGQGLQLAGDKLTARQVFLR